MSTDVTPAALDLADYVIGEILAVMGRRRITSAALGRLVGEPNYWVLRRLNRRIPLSLDDLQRIAGALDISVSALLPPRSGGLPTGRTGGPSPRDPLAPRIVAIGDANAPLRPKRRPKTRHRVNHASSQPNDMAVVRLRPATRTPR